MRGIYLLLCAAILSVSSISQAKASPLQIAFTGVCKGQSYTLQLAGSFNAAETDIPTNLSDVSLRLTDDTAAKTILNLTTANQRLFRQTAAGMSFFGIYDHSTFTSDDQTVYVQLAYQSLGLLEWMRHVYLGYPADVIKNQKMAAQFFSEQDVSSTLTMGLVCDFDVKK